MRFDRAAKDWVERTCGPGATVVSSRRLHGGLSSSVHELRVDTRSGHHLLVLRRIDPEDNPDARAEIISEGRILSALENRLVPRLLASDPSGEACGYPASVQTRLPGRPTLSPVLLDRWISGLAEAVRTVHGAMVAPTILRELPPFRPWLPVDDAPPSWSRDPAAWSEARTRVCARWPPNAPVVSGEASGFALIHRDLHPANVLFDNGELSGIVDWTNASVGPVEVDISRCRVQAALLVGDAPAWELVRHCESICERYDPIWDAMVALEIAPWLGDIAAAFRALGTDVRVASLRRSLDAIVVASL